MDVPVWVWVVTIAGFAALLTFDFYAHVRIPHEPPIKESAWWTVFYIALAAVFGVGMIVVEGGGYGAEFIAGYVTEKSLSVDNLFIFLIIMQKFAVPRQYQQRVLLIGIVIALLMRGLFIALGAAALAYFSWVFYLFGLFLLYTAWKLATEKHDPDEEYEPPALVRAVQRLIPTTPEYHGTRLFTRIDGRRFATPMLIVMVSIGMTDLLFALDSIPAIFGLTEEPYIVFTANAFALLGLMQLYFLLGGLLQRLVYLGVGLAIILGFIGVKLILHALHTNTLPFINSGESIHWVPEIPIWLSLTVILAVLVVTTVASLIKSRNDAHEEKRAS